MVESSVRVEGLDLVQSNLRRVARGYPREQKTIHQNIGGTVLDRARNRARVRTGRMRSTIRLRSTEQQAEIVAGEGIDYAGYQHWGTRYVSPNLYLTEPLRELEGRIVGDYQKLTDRYVDRTWVSNV